MTCLARDVLPLRVDSLGRGGTVSRWSDSCNFLIGCSGNQWIPGLMQGYYLAVGVLTHFLLSPFLQVLSQNSHSLSHHMHSPFPYLLSQMLFQLMVASIVLLI